MNLAGLNDGVPFCLWFLTAVVLACYYASIVRIKEVM